MIPGQNHHMLHSLVFSILYKMNEMRKKYFRGGTMVAKLLLHSKLELNVCAIALYCNSKRNCQVHRSKALRQILCNPMQHLPSQDTKNTRSSCVTALSSSRGLTSKSQVNWRTASAVPMNQFIPVFPGVWVAANTCEPSKVQMLRWKPSQSRKSTTSTV